MIFRELNHGKCKTYLAISETSRRAAIIDPLRDKVERYLAVLAYHRLGLEFVVDTTGGADSTSLRVIHSSHPAFEQSLRTALPHMRFVPAELGGSTQLHDGGKAGEHVDVYEPDEEQRRQGEG